MSCRVEALPWNLTINEYKVQKYFDGLDIKESTEPDSLSPRVLKELYQQMLQPHVVQVNNVLQDWKLANVTQVFKKEDTNVALDYRPISLTSV